MKKLVRNTKTGRVVYDRKKHQFTLFRAYKILLVAMAQDSQLESPNVMYGRAIYNYARAYLIKLKVIAPKSTVMLSMSSLKSTIEELVGAFAPPQIGIAIKIISNLRLFIEDLYKED